MLALAGSVVYDHIVSMKFDLQMQSRDFTQPVYDFPGDQTIDDHTYRSCVTSGYISSVSTLHGAAESFNLDVDPETFERWKRIGSAAGLLDDFLDESPDIERASRIYDLFLDHAFESVDSAVVPDWADDRLVPAVDLLTNSTVVLPEKQTASLLMAAKSIGQIALSKASCTDLKQYLDILRQEASASGKLVYDSASNRVRAHTDFPAFEQWVDSAMWFGTLGDSARDLRADERAGRVSVRATALNSLRIALRARQPMRAMLSPAANRSATIASLRARRGFYST